MKESERNKRTDLTADSPAEGFSRPGGLSKHRVATVSATAIACSKALKPHADFLGEYTVSVGDDMYTKEVAAVCRCRDGREYQVSIDPTGLKPESWAKLLPKMLLSEVVNAGVASTMSRMERFIKYGGKAIREGT